MNTSIKEIPTLDLMKIGKDEFAQNLFDAFRFPGFAFLGNYQMFIPDSTLLAVREDMAKFFHMPEEVRMQYLFAGAKGQHGYTPFGQESAKGSKEKGVGSDTKHFLQFRKEEHARFGIKELPLFTQNTMELFDYFHMLFRDLMRALAPLCGLEKNFFDGKLGNSVARLIHYPQDTNTEALDRKSIAGGNIAGYCAFDHEDINLLTLLPIFAAGLQLWVRGENPRWIKISPKSGEIAMVVNVGDMLQALSNGFFTSGTHRVVCEPGVERYSIPFFGHAKPEAWLTPLQRSPFVTGERPWDQERFPDETAEIALARRLKEIGLTL